LAYLAGDAAPCAEGVPGTPASVAVVGCGAGAGAIPPPVLIGHAASHPPY
jgi:hypothetical protein